MKIIALLSWLAFAPALHAAEIDLDAQFLTATGTSPRLSFALPQNAADFSRGWDGSGNLPPIVQQHPFGACQSFSMAAMMEYIFYRETGKTLKLSEKQIAYNLLKLMIGEHWDAEKKQYDIAPELGKGIAPLVVEAVVGAGLMPDAAYPWGDFASPDGSRSVDIALYQKYFEKPERGYTPAEYAAALDETFLSAPPANIRYVFKQLNYATGKEEDVLLKKPLEINQLIGVDKAKFKVWHNREMKPFFGEGFAGHVPEILEWFEGEAKHYGTSFETTTPDVITKVILRSLNNRMVVLLATDVWIGSWKDRMVYDGGGGHGVVIVGYQMRDGELYLKLRNSWGTKAGIDGYNYIKASTLMPNLLYVLTYGES